jgi:DDE family transposase
MPCSTLCALAAIGGSCPKTSTCQTVYHYWFWGKLGATGRKLTISAQRCEFEVDNWREPIAAILDSQTVRSGADQAGERGYDAAKKTKGIKRHILVDTLGLLLGVFVTPADVPERQGACGLLSKVLFAFAGCNAFGRTRAMAEEFAERMAAHRKTDTLRLEVVPRHKGQRGFLGLG